jgi:ribosomal-protein-alanine N-acetyltransferase
MSVTRLITPQDAEQLARLVTENRDYLAPWQPLQAEAFFSVSGQQAAIAHDRLSYERGLMYPLAIVDDSGAVCGRINLNGIIRGALQSASVGYWVSRSHAGRGVASAAVAEVVAAAFGPLGLHRLDAATLLHNTPSQRVLARNGFRPFAVAEAFLRIAGEWQDHILFHRLNPA